MRNFFDDPAHVRQKSHVEHAIHLVEHENVHITKMKRLLFEMIEQTSGRRDDDVDAAFQIFALLAITDAAVHNRRANVSEASVITKRGLNLSSQFARWFQNETAKFSVFAEHS